MRWPSHPSRSTGCCSVGWPESTLPAERSGRTYLTASIAIDVAIVVALALYRRTSEAESEQYMRLIMWVIWLFFASIVPKIVYAALAWIDYPVSRLRKRPSRIFSRIDWLPQP